MSNVIKLEVNRKTVSQDEVKDFIRTNFRELRRYAYSLTQDPHDADDLLQTVIERILKKSIPTDVKMQAWVFRVCRNAWIDELRSRNVRQGAADLDESELEDESEDMRPLAQFRQIELKKAIDELAEPFKAVINLVIVAGLSYAETADTLDIPIGTVMSRVARARQQLRRKLASDTDDENVDKH